MIVLQSFLNKTIDIEISGEKKHTGILIDYGQDILVLFNGIKFLYFPILHVQNIKASTNIEGKIESPTHIPIESEKEISYRKTLQHARGQFVEIYVSGTLSLHGYVTTILNDYFVFYSPVFKTIYIPMNHLKWLIPYSPDKTPFSIDRSLLPVSPSVIPLMRTFEEQLSKLSGEIVVFDLGINPNKIGLLNKLENHLVELVTADGNSYFWNIQHMMTVHSPKQL
ncbi:DUF2642 domain-containing protein [Paenibacillus endoradicis]|uniref:DUF2642 domain-containing protein n=1 Tax=Paenibacillus endoradicis TaxID=2972487 RepID=UPI0021594E1B|nr:DUF2642 domain-containing protein [Paenibacillus endoradicis]MCR8659769.1 DUF2642 domain-containing protein [Paenibacillus endoradicis]